jgi:hypothetical protein
MEHVLSNRFNPDQVAHYEAAGWRAYYDRNWLKLLQLIVGLCQEQFGIPFPNSLLAAYYVTRASAAWVPRDHDLRQVQAWYERFYRLARRYSGLKFDPARAAALELRYNEEHRRLVGSPDKQPFIQAMVDLHAELFGLSPQQALPSAELRVQANNTVDRITGRTSTDVEGDWTRLEDSLRACYRSIRSQLE